MHLLRSFSISLRLWLILAVTFLSFAVLGVMLNLEQRDALYKAKEEKTRHVVETAASILEYFQRLESTGALSPEAARKAAVDEIRGLRYGGKEYFWINDLAPTMVMHPTSPQLEGKDLQDLKDPDGKQIFVEMVRIAKQSGAGIVSYQWSRPGETKPAPKISYVKLFEPWGWVIGSGIYVDDVEKEVTGYLIKFTATALVLFVIMAAIMAILIRSIIQPLRQTTEALANIASGEGDLTRRLDDSEKDELALLSRHFNSFSTKLRNLIQELLDSAHTVDTASQSLAALSEQTYQQSQQQAQQMDLVATAINEVTYSVQEVAKNAEQASSEVGSAEKQAGQGQLNVESTLKQISQLSGTIGQAVEVMQSLAEQSSQIGTVVEVIGSIAEQTNLLALNAAIEAARAGEQGRGFAVVADEVRLLAQRTQQSTAEIHTMIEQLQQNSGAAVNVIQASNRAMQMTIDQATQAGDSLQRIAESTRNLSGLNASIASATLQQSHVVEDINQNVTRAAELAQQSTQAAEHSSEASKRLGQLASELNRSLGQFRI